MRILTIILCIIVLIATGLPLINSSAWWIRMFDFPRIQIAILTLATIILAYFFINFKWKYKLPIMVALALALIYQVHFVLAYTPLYKKQAKKSELPIGENSLTLLVSNVRMQNEEKERFLALVKKHSPDVLLINEPDQSWAESISKLDTDFPYSVKYPLDNTYGIILLSKLPLTESKVHFLVKDNIPSIFTKVILPSGQLIDLYCVHPEPPKPGTDTYQRDTELLIIGRKIKETNNPSIVAGDLNDVGWSVTSKLFRKYSELVDPREGRGLYNTYNVFVPFLRYPLDHIFYSREFGLQSLKKLEDIGSDHYPLLISLNYEPQSDNTDAVDKTNASENAEVDETIKNGQEETTR